MLHAVAGCPDSRGMGANAPAAGPPSETMEVSVSYPRSVSSPTDASPTVLPELTVPTPRSIEDTLIGPVESQAGELEDVSATMLLRICTQLPMVVPGSFIGVRVCIPGVWLSGFARKAIKGTGASCCSSRAALRCGECDSCYLFGALGNQADAKVRFSDFVSEQSHGSSASDSVAVSSAHSNSQWVPPGTLLWGLMHLRDVSRQAAATVVAALTRGGHLGRRGRSVRSFTTRCLAIGHGRITGLADPLSYAQAARSGRSPNEVVEDVLGPISGNVVSRPAVERVVGVLLCRAHMAAREQESDSSVLGGPGPNRI